MNVFDIHGRIDTSIDPMSIPKDRRQQFQALVAAQIACDEAERNEKAANENVAQCVRTHNEAATRVPRQTITDLVKETFGLV